MRGYSLLLLLLVLVLLLVPLVVVIDVVALESLDTETQPYAWVSSVTPMQLPTWDDVEIDTDSSSSSSSSSSSLFSGAGVPSAAGLVSVSPSPFRVSPRSFARTDFDVIPASHPASVSSFTHEVVETVIHHQLVRGHVLRCDRPLTCFSIEEPGMGCPGFARTTVTSEDRGCDAAMNAGFFDIHRGFCLGNLVSGNGEVVSLRDGINVNFGLTKKGEFVIGYLTKKDLEAFEWRSLVSGIGWLLRNGSVYLDESIARENPGFGWSMMKAPRTAVGVDADGRLLLLEIDGSERLNQGVDLYEFAEILRSWGFVHAVNIDGGGSAAVVVRGKLMNKPSDNCPRGPGTCERMVTTIACLRNR